MSKLIVDNAPVWVEVDCEGEVTGHKYVGRFSIKRYLTRQELADVARLSETFSRGISGDMVTIKVMDLLARLQFHIVESDCQWWDKKEGGLNLPDDEPIYKIYEAVMSAAMSWKKKDKPEEKKD